LMQKHLTKKLEKGNGQKIFIFDNVTEFIDVTERDYAPLTNR
jgi:hypothetical protein